ncbi:MAG: prepilin peptidase [Lachnospiraceae bacterium]
MERNGLFLCFLLVAAGQDIRDKHVEVRVFALFGLLAVMLSVYQWTTGVWNGWIDLVSNLCIAAGIIGAAVFWKDAIGFGDGCFFLVSGILLGFWENLALLFYGMLLCGSYCLLKLVICQLRNGQNVRNQTVPFLPFLVPVGVWLVFLNG